MESSCKKAKLSTSSHVCNTCCKSFAQRAGLSRHMKTAHTDAKWNCTICETTFGRRDNYQRHLKAHNQIGGGSNKARNKVRQQSYIVKHQGTVRQSELTQDNDTTEQQPVETCNDRALGGTVTTHTITTEGIAKFDPMTFLRSKYDNVKDVIKQAIKERG